MIPGADAPRTQSSRMIGHVVPVVMAAVAIMAVSGCGIESSSTGAVGTPAPAYAAATLAGDTVSLGSLEGQAVLLNIWATWCPPCREETPELQALYERYRDRGLEVVGVTIDGAAAESAVRTFVEDFGVTYTILHDPEERVSNIFRIRGVPTTVLIGRNGTVLWRKVGPVHAEDSQLVEAIQNALAPTAE